MKYINDPAVFRQGKMFKMQDSKLGQLNRLFQGCPAVKLVYFFGSRAQKTEGPLSDYDFAFFCTGRDQQEMGCLKLDLIAEISRLLKTDNIDLICLNTAQEPELKYNIIQQGRLIFEREPYKVLVEPRILQEYFDFKLLLSRYNLTKTSAVQDLKKQSVKQ